MIIKIFGLTLLLNAKDTKNLIVLDINRSLYNLWLFLQSILQHLLYKYCLVVSWLQSDVTKACRLSITKVRCMIHTHTSTLSQFPWQVESAAQTDYTSIWPMIEQLFVCFPLSCPKFKPSHYLPIISLIKKCACVCLRVNVTVTVMRINGADVTEQWWNNSVGCNILHFRLFENAVNPKAMSFVKYQRVSEKQSK